MKFKFLASAVLASVLVTWTASALPGSYPKTYRDAVRFYENGMFDHARVLFEDLSRQSPEDPMCAGYVLMCAIQQKAEGFEESIANYGTRYGRTPLSSQIHHLYAVSLFDDGRYEEAARQPSQQCSESMESMILPSGERNSSPGSVGAFHARPVTSKTLFSRLEAVSSGPKTRKFSGFIWMISRTNPPKTVMSCSMTAPGCGSSTA